MPGVISVRGAHGTALKYSISAIEISSWMQKQAVATVALIINESPTDLMVEIEPFSQ